jgi:flagellar biosynthesis chaperone FliJ
MDYDGLKELQAYYEDLKNTQKERASGVWINKCANISQSVNVDINKIKQCFENNSYLKPSLQNLVGNSWITENEIEKIFALLNEKFTDTVCVVHKPDHYMNKTQGGPIFVYKGLTCC